MMQLPVVPEYAVHNAHMFFIKARDLEQRTRLIRWMKEHGIMSVFHYIPLHSAPAGRKFGRFSGEDVYTTKESERLMRLPMFYNLSSEDVDRVIQAVREFPEFR